MEVAFYTVEHGQAGLMLHAGWGLAPLALLTIIARRMGRGWLSMSLPWMLLVAIGAVYIVPAMQFASRSSVGVAPAIWAHLIGVGAPVALVVTLVVLAVVGAQRVSNQAERPNAHS